MWKEYSFKYGHIEQIISYLIQFVYGDVCCPNRDSARAAKWKGKKKKEIPNAPPT